MAADSSQVQEQLRNVRIQATANGAVAAILESGTVVTWGPSLNLGRLLPGVVQNMAETTASCKSS